MRPRARLRMQRARTLLAAVPASRQQLLLDHARCGDPVAQERGYGVLVTCRLGDDPAPLLAEYFLSNRADGLLIFDGLLQTRKLHSLSSDGRTVPLVAAYDELPDPADHIRSSPTISNRRSGRSGTSSICGHTADRSCRGAVAQHLPQRAAGGLSQGDVRTPAGPQGRLDLPGRLRRWRAALRAAAHFAALKERPTAIFSANDDMAIGAHRRASGPPGIDCPRDISVIGFDDIAMSRSLFPGADHHAPAARARSAGWRPRP